ncbi:MAG: hypothetical protein KBA03_05415 [Anaerolineaceae bacterium]|nr:hypothetical protein [Anaerolineaceae bacterium]
MFPNLDTTEATYLVRIILSLALLIVFFVLAFVMIRKKQKAAAITKKTVLPEAPGTENEQIDPLSAEAKPSIDSSKNADKSSQLRKLYHSWQTKRLLETEDKRGLFLRTGVERNGLNYQLVATTQTQAFAILLTALMSEKDPDSTKQAEALFAVVLAHPAYGQEYLSSWKFMPDKPRSPRLDPGLQAEAWLILALNYALDHLPEMKRFDYAQILEDRARALIEITSSEDENLIEKQPFGAFLERRIKNLNPDHAWIPLGETKQSFFEKIENFKTFIEEGEGQKLGFGLMQLGLMAKLDQDGKAEKTIRQIASDLTTFVEALLEKEAEDQSFSQTSLLACLVPAVLCLDNQSLTERLRARLLVKQTDKNDGLGATLQLLGLALLEK